MTEPEYRYIKGQGWVPTSTRTEDFFWGHFRVTIEDRVPSPDEYYCRLTLSTVNSPSGLGVSTTGFTPRTTIVNLTKSYSKRVSRGC